MKRLQLLALSLLATMGCSQGTVDATNQKIKGPQSFPMLACSPTPPTPRLGVVKIVLPKSLDLSDPERAVHVDLDPNSDPESDDPAKDETGGDNPDTSTQMQPFNVYLKRLLPAQPMVGFLAVKVIIKADRDYSFYNDNGIPGVALGAQDSTKRLCGAHILPNSATKRRQVAVFFVDMSKVKRNDVLPFNIGVKPNKHVDTPIFIDPKVRNDG